jgi:hypothetical protein
MNFGRIWVLSIVMMFCLVGCTSKKSAGNSETSGTAKNQAASATGYDLDLNCVFDSIQKPTEAFHYSYHKTDPDNPVEEDADVTPQTIDGSFKNNSGTHPIHGVRSDQQSWQMAYSGLMGVSGMSSTIALVRNGSAVQKEGSEQVNGYQTVKYSVDTSRGDSVEQSLYKSTLGDGGFEKGTWWVNAQGCPVKLSLDTEMRLNNGNIQKIHYEIAMVKK